MKKLGILLFLIPAFTISQSESLEQKFDRVLSSYKTESQPGIAAGVIQDGELLYLKGFGVEDVETKQKITTQTKFQVDDLAKQFTVLSILLLEEDGKLSLEDDVRKYLPELPDYGDILKIKHLVNHTSGLYNLDPVKELLSVDSNDTFTQEDAIKIISAQKKLNFKPGTRFSYHRADTEIILLTEVVKAITKDSFLNFTKKELFEPLGMENTEFNNDSGLQNNRAKSYLIAENISYNHLKDFTLGATNLYTTAEDFAKWFQLHHSNTKLANLIKKLDNYVALDSGEEYYSTWGKMTLGRYFDHPERGLQKMSWSFGLVGGYCANFFRFQSHDVISFVLGNNNRYNGMPTMLLANEIMEGEYTEPPEIDYTKINFESLSNRKLRKHEGYYWNKSNGLVRQIYIKNDTLQYRRISGRNTETALLPLSKDTFQMYQRGDTENLVTFYKDRFEFSSLNSNTDVYYKINQVDVSFLNLSEYQGIFYNKELDLVYHFSQNENGLTGSNFNSRTIQFFPIVKDNFRSNTFMLSGIKFLRDSQNEVSGFEIYTDGVSGLSFQRIADNALN